MTSAKHFFDETLFRVGKAKQRNEKKNSGKHGISYTDVLKTYATSFKKNSFAVSNQPKCIELS